MSRDKDFKRLVRRRMRKTGESYTAARSHFVRTHGRRTSPTPSGGSAMFPFERFTEQAKKALTAAQVEAQQTPERPIGTAQLLLGLVADSRSDASRVLRALGIERPELRAAVERQAAEEGDSVQPTEPAKRAIEFAFTESKRTDYPSVGTGHLLVGILLEGSGAAARALIELGVGYEAARAALGRLQAPVERGLRNDASAWTIERHLNALISSAQELAVDEKAPSVRIDHLVRAMAQDESSSWLLARLGLDLRTAVAGVPAPPPRMVELQASLRDFEERRQAAAARRDAAAVAEIQAAQQQPQRDWEAAYRDWIGSWGPGQG
jgi:ATP-dependent Clp protease ATP-binding subunit ClpA